MVESELEHLKQALVNQLEKLQKLNIYHRDIKPANIIMTEDYRPKITDFGLAELVKPKPNGKYKVSPCGTPDFWAPEVGGYYKSGNLIYINLWKADYRQGRSKNERFHDGS